MSSTRHRSLLPLTSALAGALVAGTVIAGGAAVADRGDRDRERDQPTTAQIDRLFGTWNRALATGDAERVTRLFAEDATLLSTLDADVKVGRDEIEAYFAEQFLPKRPQGTITESHTHVIDADSAYRTGLYEFRLTADDGKVTEVPARFTFVYEKVDGRWLIDSLHSSVQP